MRAAKLIIPLIACFIATLPLCAQHHGEGHDAGESKRNWMLMLGLGVVYMPLYDGSDKGNIEPFPYFNGEFNIDDFALFASIEEGIGGRYTLPGSGFFLESGINMGKQRDPGNKSVKELLRDTPQLKNPVSAFATAGSRGDWGKLILKTEYFATQADYEPSIAKDISYNAVLLSAKYRYETFIIENILVGGGVKLSFMNDDYAKAYHSVKYETASLKKFSAGAGIHSVTAEYLFLFFFSEHVGTGVFGKSSYLLGDAASSPLTKTRFCNETGVLALYNF